MATAAKLLISLGTGVCLGPSVGAIAIPGAPFSPSFPNKFNDTSGLDHLSGPLLGPLGQFLRESVTNRLPGDLKLARLGVTIKAWTTIG